MKLQQLLEEFYLKNGIPLNGGDDETTFEMRAFGTSFQVPNPKFRRDVIYIHDAEHVIKNCDTSWKGEAFIAGWEIATGMWKYFPVGLLSFWAMGYSLWLHPKSVFKGFEDGVDKVGLLDLKMDKKTMLALDINQLQELIQTSRRQSQIRTSVYFICWSVVSQFVFLFPIILLLGVFLLNSLT